MIKIELTQKELQELESKPLIKTLAGNMIGFEIKLEGVNYFEATTDKSGVIGIDQLTLNNLNLGIPFNVANVIQLTKSKELLSKCCEADTEEVFESEYSCTNCRKKCELL